MKRIKQLLFLMVFISFSACKNDATGEEGSKENNVKGETVNYSDSTNADCVAPASWFKMVNGTRKTDAPDEGPSSVFANNATVKNCDFHQWSWQKFLWLTNETNGRPFFLDSLIQVTSHGIKLEEGKGVILTDTAQASSKTDILRTPSDPSTTVYYAIFMDDLLYNTMLKYAPIAQKDPSAIDSVTFPIGALELKTSWIDVNALEDTASYFITDGEINGEKARVALLAMHVVGIVENHPEFIWATFEHNDLAPAYDWSLATPTSDAPVTSTVDYLFFSAGANSTVKNITSGNGIYTDVFSVYKYGVPVQKIQEGSFDVQVFMETSQDGSQNFNNIRTINESVKSQLSGIWNEYFYNGSIWIDTEGYEGIDAQAFLLDSLGHNLSNSDTSGFTRGSVAAYNITMETYVQVGFNPTSIHGQTVGDLVNCLSCHSAQKGDNFSPLYISHVFKGYLGQLNGLNKHEVKNASLEDMVEHIKVRYENK